MKKEKPTTKICKHCRTEIPYKAKVCPQCRKKQKKGMLFKIVIVLVALLVIGSMFGSNDEKEVTEEKTEFVVGESFNKDGVVINYISSGDYVTDNEFMVPAEGNKYIFTEFEVENNSDSDFGIGSWDFACYADGYACDETYFDEDAFTAYDSISSGKKIKGKIYYEVPEDSKDIVLEYETDFWEESKITFIVQ